MMWKEAGFYNPVKFQTTSYGRTIGYAMVMPRRTNPSSYKIVTAFADEYKDLDDFFFSIARKRRMPASQLTRIPLLVELQEDESGIRHALVYRPIGNWRRYRNKIKQRMDVDTVVWHDREV